MKQRVILVASQPLGLDQEQLWKELSLLPNLEFMRSERPLDQRPFDLVLSAEQAAFFLGENEWHTVDLKEHLKGLGKQKNKAQDSDFARALKLHQDKTLNIWDLTCGTGFDLCLMKHFGAQNLMGFERHPAVYASLRWAQSFCPELHGVKLVFGNALTCDDFKTTDIIYFDPMYPSKKKKSALAQKGMELFKLMVGKDEDSKAMALLALKKASQRLVIKRPVRAEFLLGEPSFCYRSKSVRYDIYEPASFKMKISGP